MTSTGFERLGNRLALAALALIWGMTWCTLSAQWSANPQYSFGWLTPPLAVYLALSRWVNRPAPTKLRSWYPGLLSAALLTLLPVWLLLQPNPDWRLLHWLLAVDAVAITFSLLNVAGGQAWVGNFAVPACLVLFAVPWPSEVEAWIIGGLMRLVAAVSVVLLNFLGTPAVQLGNLIETKAGLLGIDEACSGVRSLQATLMASFTFGEIYRLPRSGRLLLVCLGILTAFVTNIIRATILGWIAASKGLNAVNTWHDPAGFGVMIACFLLVWVAATLLPKSHVAPPVVEPPSSSKPFPVRLGTMIIGWALGVIIATEIWFRTGPLPASLPAWQFRWPTDVTELREVPIAKAAAQMLQYDHGRGLAWTDSHGDRWLAYHLQWDIGPARSRILARMHRPEYCLPSTGWQATSSSDELQIDADGIRIPLQQLQFSQGSRRIDVWFSTTEAGAIAGPTREESARMASIRAVLNRERSRAQQVLEVVRLTAPSGRSADVAFKTEIQPLLQRTVPK